MNIRRAFDIVVMNTTESKQNQSPYSKRNRPRYYTASELSEAGENHIPEIYQTGSHLIYSSPATLAYNSPGAEGFGVKRAGLSIPGSVMLIVSPGCCGRNTAEITRIKGCEDRFFYLQMNETDLVTGRHLRRIPDAVRRIAAHLPQKPSVIMICITCADALLGTDLERVCRKAEQETGLPVRPCYMYALTREGRKPPMVYVRESLYSMVPAQKKKSTSVNLLGFFAPVHPESELFELLKKAGVRKIRQISTCCDLQDFYHMGEANFNLVLHPEARGAADALTDRLGIPSIELSRFYETDLTEKQYHALFGALGLPLPVITEGICREDADKAGALLKEKYPDLSFSIGEVVNANPFELALALLRMGWKVEEIFADPSPESYPFIDRIARLCPELKIYSNTDPSMLSYQRPGKDTDVPGRCERNPDTAGSLSEDSEDGLHITIGKDAAYYRPDALHLYFNEDTQPFGYEASWYLWSELIKLIEGRNVSADIPQRGDYEPSSAGAVRTQENLTREEGAAEVKSGEEAAHVPGLEGEGAGPGNGPDLYLTPFAPDQSGAVSALYALDGMIVILDAGGCTGNILGFDEPRWQNKKAAVFSAGLRDMDAIMGRDRELVRKAKKAFQNTGCSFIALVGTPVPSIIGTDYHALERMLEKQCNCPVISIPTNGMKTYEDGLSKTYLTLFRRFSHKNDTEDQGERKEAERGKSDIAGVIGSTPLELVRPSDQESIRQILVDRGFRKVIFYGSDATREDYERAGENAMNFVLSGAGVQAAVYLEKTFGTPFEIGYPGIEEELQNLPPAFEHTIGSGPKRALILHDPVVAASLKSALQKRYAGMKLQTDCASFFAGRDLDASLMVSEGVHACPDISLKGEQDLLQLLRDRRYDFIFADPVCAKIPAQGAVWIPFPCFAISGKRILT
ncbi:MAG: nitrogenase component 1 [Bilifractor sp.]